MISPFIVSHLCTHSCAVHSPVPPTRFSRVHGNLTCSISVPCLSLCSLIVALVTMHRVNPRRSACDRCRSHKLRCVRLDQNSNTAVVNSDALVACQRCLKAGTDCVHTVHIRGKTTKPDNHPPRHLSSSSAHSTSYQRTIDVARSAPTAEQQLKAFSFDMSAPSTTQTQMRKSGGGGGGGFRPDEAASSSRPIFAHPPPEKSQLGSPKAPRLLSHDSQAAAAGSGGSSTHRSHESSNVTPPTRIPDKPQGSDHALPFDMDKGDFDGLGFSTVTSLSHESTGMSTHLLQYPPEEPLVSSTYFVDATESVGAGSQSLHEQQMSQVSGSTTDECLHRLSQLSSKLLRDFGKTSSSSSSNIGDLISFRSTLPNSTSTWHQITPADGAATHHLSNIISKLFESLQIFLDTIERLRPFPPNNHSSADSECSYSDQWDETDFVSTTDDDQIYQSTIPLDHIHGPSDAHQGGVGPPKSADTTPPNKPRPFDMPATLTILTCYTWLLKGYEMVLSGIQDALVSQDRLRGLRSLPSILHGPGLGSFSLQDHPDMQIEIVIHIGSQLLHRIEGILGIHVISDPRNSSDHQAGSSRAGLQPDQEQEAGGLEILDTHSAAALLDVWFGKSGNGQNPSEDACRGRREEIEGKVENIRRLLRGYWREVRGK